MGPFRRFAILASVAVVAAMTLPVLAAGAVGGTGYDVSWPQCGAALPADGGVAVLGVSGGRPYEDNPCLASEYGWASSAGRELAFYMNTANPGPAGTSVNWYGQRTPDATCSPAKETACAFDYGYGAAAHAYGYALARTGTAARHSWWLDVETGNSWSSDQALNGAVVVGAVALLRNKGVPVGVYSTSYQWGRITGGARLDLPSWVAGARNAGEAAQFCAPSHTVTGGPVAMVQWVQGHFDHDLVCTSLPAAAPPPPATAPASSAISGAIADLLRLNIAKALADLSPTAR
ncbi:MAG: hypothetical protein ABR511_05320 [Acidimicrobiales bacterium]